MMRRAITLIELLVVVAILGFLTMGVTRAYIQGIDFDTKVREGRSEAAAIRAFEDRLVDYLSHATLSTDPSDLTTYFIGGAADGLVSSSTADSITFTVAGTRIPTPVLQSQDDFETLNERFGPQGGIAEISISLTPVGDSGGRQGLFIREQRPSDGDPTQGGYERILNQDVVDATFEFWDGLSWIPDWNTQTQTTPRLPAAIRLTYRFADDENDRVLIVKVPMSDVNAQYPLTEVGT